MKWWEKKKKLSSLTIWVIQKVWEGNWERLAVIYDCSPVGTCKHLQHFNVKGKHKSFTTQPSLHQWNTNVTLKAYWKGCTMESVKVRNAGNANPRRKRNRTGPTHGLNPDCWSTKDVLLIPSGIWELWDWLLSADCNEFPKFLFGEGSLLLGPRARYKKNPKQKKRN